MKNHEIAFKITEDKKSLLSNYIEEQYIIF